MTAHEGPADPAAQISSYLSPGEQLIWAGRPDPDVRFAPVDAFVVPFSVMWGSFAIFWEASVLTGGAPLSFTLWGIPFVAVGLYVMFGRFIYKRRRKLKTAYGITTSRAIVAVGSSTMSDSPISGVPTSVRHSRNRRHVSVTFGARSGWPAWGMYANTGMDFFDMGSPSVAFFDVATPEALLDALQRARSG